jgi:hypothetical protein
MALTQYTTPTNVIGSLGTTPEDRPGMTDQQLKDKFDLNAVNIAAFLNSLISELASTSAGKGASQIGLQDLAGRFTAADVEAALAEIAGAGRTTETLKGLGDIISTLSGAVVKKDGTAVMTDNLDFNADLGMRIKKGNATSIMQMDFPEVTTAGANVRIFRNTNTSGGKALVLCNGDGTLTVAFQIFNGIINTINGVAVSIMAGSGAPEGSRTAPVGSIYLRSDGGAGTSIYVKQSGTGNTGWAAK